MKGELCLCLLLVGLATSCLSRADAHQLGRAPGPDERRSSGTGPVQRDLLGALSQDQKLLMAKFLPHIYAELANREGHWHEDDALRSLHDHDYPGWMDFGRRSLSESDEAA
ncbi:gastrin [Chelonoidis abingdonii]|uniref:Gastrin/cholecystokinin peptide hormone domain-containing protein n=1 Tax=Chelonoidis abingdonii TaxID=106734 RepID=A0A8C0H969_CHEAB|nr:gastrin/cholecystokinin-like peptide [Chelonoidis abingdonii]XP_032644877.1 gastrin/cholecystokinin-like peptide [Chelonoidis abingdonii]